MRREILQFYVRNRIPSYTHVFFILQTKNYKEIDEKVNDVMLRDRRVYYSFIYSRFQFPENVFIIDENHKCMNAKIFFY